MMASVAGVERPQRGACNGEEFPAVNMEDGLRGGAARRAEPPEHRCRPHWLDGGVHPKYPDIVGLGKLIQLIRDAAKVLLGCAHRVQAGEEQEVHPARRQC